MCNLRAAQIVSSECVLLHQNWTNSILYMLYTLMRCIHSFKTTCQNTDVDARFKLYLNITPALYPNVVCLVMCIHMCELADVVVRYNSAQQVVLDGRPCCQSKPMRHGVGAPRPPPDSNTRSNRQPIQSLRGKCDLRVEPLEFNETCTQATKSNSKNFSRI